MVIRCCNTCIGNPYTTDLSMEYCPNCHTLLNLEFVTEDDVKSRPLLSYDTGADEPDVSPIVPGEKKKTDMENPAYPSHSSRKRHENQNRTGKKEAVDVSTFGMNPDGRTKNTTVENSIGSVLRGTISHYSSSGNEDGHYRRLFVSKLIDALVYGQRWEDTLHRFTVRVQGDMDVFGNVSYYDVPVNVHGTIASGIQLSDNTEVEVRGKYRNGVLMASQIEVVSNGYKTPVTFQHTTRYAGAVIAVGLIGVILFWLIRGVVQSLQSGGGMQGAGSSVGVFIVLAILIWILFGRHGETKARSSRRGIRSAVLLLAVGALLYYLFSTGILAIPGSALIYIASLALAGWLFYKIIFPG